MILWEQMLGILLLIMAIKMALALLLIGLVFVLYKLTRGKKCQS